MASANILIVVPHLPQPATCAGDWRIGRLCRVLSAEYHVFMLPIRSCPPAEIPFWKEQGVDVLVPDDPMNAFPSLLQQYSFAAVIFEWFHTAHHFFRFLPLCPRVVIDTHELYYMKARRRYAVLGERSLPAAYPEDIRLSELSVYRAADLLLAVSPEEEAVLRAEFPDKDILALPLLTDTGSDRPLSGFEQRQGIVFLGSFQHPEENPNTDAVRYFADAILPAVRRALPAVSFHVAGFGSEAIRINNVVNDGPVRNVLDYINAFRVFVCPLRFGAGLKKKVMDAAVAGCPVVTTSVGNEGTGFINDRHIFVADDPVEFADRIIRVYNDPVVWNSMSSAARERAVARSEDGVEQIIGYFRSYQGR